ncbi:thiol-disulfide oxidoreductase DCC family protein [Actinomycetota bacterium]
MAPETTSPGGGPLLVFDGDCGFCTRSAEVAERWVRRPEGYAVQPWQRLDLEALGLTAEECDEALQFVGADGRVSAGSDAVAAALRAGRLPWRPLGLLLAAPPVRPVAGRVYRWVAAHRHSLPGGTPACRMPQA